MPKTRVQPFYSPYLYYQTRAIKPFVAKAENIYIWDHDGKRYMDGSSGAVICNIGHGDKRILETIQKQAEQTFFTYRTQFENEPAHRLAQKLVENSAHHLNRVFFVNSGSEAVESALKLSQQYYYARGDSRNLIISRFPSYHGATLGALSVTAYAVLENPFRQLLKGHPRIPAPYCYRCEYKETYPECGVRCAWALEQCIRDYGSRNVAAFIAEPVTGASGGAIVPPQEYFGIIQEICNKYDIVLILDEVMTGYGRTGKLFAYEHWDVKPDIICLSKGMGSGYFPMGATISRREIVDTVMADGGFKHGHTYAGAPMGCAVGEAVLDIMIKDRLPENAAAMGEILGAGLQKLAEEHPIIGNVRGTGLLWAVELVADRDKREPFPSDMEAAVILTQESYDEGLIVYPRRSINGARGDHILVSPPLVINEEQIAELLELLKKGLIRTEDKLSRSMSTRGFGWKGPRDEFIEIDGSVVHHGPLNQRAFLIDPAPEVDKTMPEKLEALAQESGYTKLAAKIPAALRPDFEKAGFEVEAQLPGYFNGKKDALFAAKFLSKSRGKQKDAKVIKAVLDTAAEKAGENLPTQMPENLTITDLDTDYVQDLTLLYQCVFSSYPVPLYDDEFILETMRNDVHYFGVLDETGLIGAASIHFDNESEVAQLCDFAVLSSKRMRGLGGVLLAHLEKQMKERGIKTAFSITRALSFGINIIMAKAGYEYTGTLRNHAYYNDEIESMNIWVKHLDKVKSDKKSTKKHTTESEAKAAS